MGLGSGGSGPQERWLQEDITWETVWEETREQVDQEHWAELLALEHE